MPIASDTTMLESEYAPHFGAWQADPSPVNAGKLLQATRPVLDAAVRSYGGASPSPTLRSRAKLMALEAFGKYDPNRAKLRTHLMVHLQGLRRMAAKETQLISIPERVGLDLHKLRTAENELRDRLARDPSDIELSGHTGLSPKRIGYIRQARPGYSEGFIQAATQTAEDAGGFTPAVKQTGGIDPHLLQFVYHDLDPADQVILEHTLGMNRKAVLPKQQIAAKLGISPGAVSQRAARIQERLNIIGDAGLAGFGG